MLDEIINNVARIKYKLGRLFPNKKDCPSILILVTRETLYNTKNSIKGQTYFDAYDFVVNNKILGHPVCETVNLNGAPYLIHVDFDATIKGVGNIIRSAGSARPINLKP